MAQYGQCEYCGADKILNPKTGKIFCGDKCWLNGPQAPKPSYKKPFSPKPEPDWERIRAEKEESMIFLNAKNNAAVMLGAAIQKGDLTLDDALARYDEVAKKIYESGKD